jgi:hypothetical protein
MGKYRETRIGLAEIIKIVCVYIFYVCTLIIVSINIYSAIDTTLSRSHSYSKLFDHAAAPSLDTGSLLLPHQHFNCPPTIQLDIELHCKNKQRIHHRSRLKSFL